jgi:hypothetical protein
MGRSLVERVQRIVREHRFDHFTVERSGPVVTPTKSLVSSSASKTQTEAKRCTPVTMVLIVNCPHQTVAETVSERHRPGS